MNNFNNLDIKIVKEIKGTLIMLNYKEKSRNYYNCKRTEMLKYLPDSAQKILDVGCAEASFGALIKEKNNAEVWGIELNSEIAECAKEKIDKVLVGDISEKITELPDNYFDCIFFNDVLEHLYDPYTLLKQIKYKLNNEGIIICSLPNIRHCPVLKDLILNKQWKYNEHGVLDFTHIRFFTQKSIIEMFENLDYSILKIEGINGHISFKKIILLDILSLGFFSDAKYPQFACIIKPKS